MLKKIFTILICLIIISCKNDQHTDELEIKMDQLNNKAIQALIQKKIFFGHMSVGYNIIDGLKDLIQDDDRLKEFRLIELTDKIEINEPGFYHSRNGKNGFPDSKCDAFKNFLFSDSIGRQFDIALFKFCYVDLNPESNVKDIFNYYVETIENVKTAFPNLEIVHVTAPLMVHNYTLKSTIKSWIKGDRANINRNRFNQLLLQKYGKQAPIFDLAAAESTYPDHSREFFTVDKQQYYSLIKEYTSDGGHLNEAGRKLAAMELLKTLTRE
jgi:hypothetical protein